MKKTKEQKSPQQLKRKLIATLCMLLVATIMLTTTSYAWLVLSIAPEVSGITTNVGANGALEIALLTTATRADLTQIRTTIGESLATRRVTANNTWGNLIDLSYADYGLGNILLLPARLNITAGADGYSVAPNLLSVPTYGYDGRIIELNDETMSAAYQDGEFSLVIGAQDYGVRAIGTTNNLSVQGSALALAKSNIKTYLNSAKSETNSVLSKNGDTLFNMMMTHAMDSQATFGDTDLDAMKSLLSDLQNVLNYVDLSLRQGVVAVAASEIASKDTFVAVNDRIMDTSRTLADILSDLEEVGQLPGEFTTWVTRLSQTQNSLNVALNMCNELSGGSYTWDVFRGILDHIMNLDFVYINDTLYKDFDKSNAGTLLGGNVKITLGPNSGIFADIAEFIGNYSSMMTYVGTNIEITTAVATEAYLVALGEAVKDLEAADSTGAGQEAVALTATYGYALDLAFRCNAAGSDLLLQTTPENRIYEESTVGSTMGGGSYMEFSTDDSAFTVAKMIELMDAIRVAFIDDQNRILGVAKLNTSNRVLNEGTVKSPLYLYEFELSDEDGSILMGERRLGDNVIASLTQNVAKAITAVVWLDGDIVDNTMVSATESASLTGVLNLQFASSANLIPADNSDLLNLSADKNALETLLLDNRATMEAGQGTYTTISWDAFTVAYQYANAVYENDNATDTQVYTAALSLTQAVAGLEKVSPDALDARADEIRAEMGTYATGDNRNPVRYVIKNTDGTYAVKGEDGYTQEEFDSWNIVHTIYQVNHDQNLHDEGNDIYTEIYTEASWTALANALYNAEATVLKPDATDGEVNSALTALETAYNSLQRKVFYTPYEYNGRIYYEAICDANNADTYGKWYDSNFKRIVADITILNLDAYARPVDIARIEQEEFVLWNTERITPVINILDEVYAELSGEEILGANWDIFDETMFRELMDQHHITTLNTLIGIINDEKLDIDTAGAEALLASESPVAASTARSVIAGLSSEIQVALEIKEAEAAAANPYMTNSQRILLTAAVNTAKTITGFSDETKTELASLRTAVAHAEELLALVETIATKTAADTALSDLNAALKAQNVKEITAYNTLVYFPYSVSDVHAYPVEYPGATLALTGKTGETQLKALVLTKNGILFTVSKDILIYTPADGASICLRQETLVDNQVVTQNVVISSLDLTLGQELDTEIAATLHYLAAAHAGKEETLGNVVIEGEQITILFQETAARWTWASENMDIVIANPGRDGRCTLSAKSAGTTYVTVTVETDAGNTYTARISVTVNG